jgi:hypothetical protein
METSTEDAAEQQKMEKVRQQLIDRLHRTSESMAAYTVVVIFGAFAAIFTIWSYTKDYLGEWATYWVGALLGTSIMVFVAFEVFKVAATGFSSVKVVELLNKDLSPSDFFIQQKALVKKQSEFNQLVNIPIWKAALFITVVTGFGAAGILMFHFVSAIAKGQI